MPEFDKKRRRFIVGPVKSIFPFSKSRIVSEAREIGGCQVHWIEMGKVSRVLSEPIQNAIEHAKALAAEAYRNNLPIKLFLSGGIDSEVMAEAFLLAQVNFEVVIGRYNDDLNYHDYKDAVAFCEQHNLKVEFIDIDVFSFLENGGALKYAQELGCRSPQIAVHLHMLDQVSGFCILAGNPIFPVFKNSDQMMLKQLRSKKLEIANVWGAPNQTQSVYLRWFEKRNRRGEPFFFQSSSDLCMSFLNLDEIVSFMAVGVKNHDYRMKCQMYSLAGFKATARKDKYTGFEKYRSAYDKKMNTLWGTGFDDCFRKPLEELYPALPVAVSFILPAQIAEKLISKLTCHYEPSVDSTFPNHFVTSRRQLFGRASAISGTFFVSLFLPRFAQAASCACCTLGTPGLTLGLQSAGDCAKLCTAAGYTEMQLGGGSCDPI